MDSLLDALHSRPTWRRSFSLELELEPEYLHYLD